jgi:hypothetical protein
MHDFLDPDKGRAAPYGIYDLGAALLQQRQNS